MAAPRWRKEETILALDLYLRCGLHHRDPTADEIRKHLELLHRLGMPPRSEASIKMKRGNFAALDDRYSGNGLGNASTQDREVWFEFAKSPVELRQTVERIKGEIRRT